MKTNRQIAEKIVGSLKRAALVPDEYVDAVIEKIEHAIEWPLTLAKAEGFDEGAAFVEAEHEYTIFRGLFEPPLHIKIKGLPPCLFCGKPVSPYARGTEGPLVCGNCDCGHNEDGTQWTSEQAKERWEHRRQMMARYVEQFGASSGEPER